MSKKNTCFLSKKRTTVRVRDVCCSSNVLGLYSFWSLSNIAYSSALGFNYTIKLVEDGNYGSFNKETGKWNGMIGELQVKICLKVEENIFNSHKNIYRSKRLTWWLPTSPSRTSASREWTSRCPSWTWAWRSSTRSRPRRILICSPSYLRCLLTSGSTSSRLIWPCPSCSSQSLGKSAHQQQHFECFCCQHS